MPADTIVGYTYQADMWCWDCMFRLARVEAYKAGDATCWGDTYQTEQVLDAWARSIGLDRSDEGSFDSESFPKVILSVEANDESYDHCGQCRECIDHEPEDCGRVS